MGVTLTDPNILVNLPKSRGEGAGKYFFQRNKDLNPSGLRRTRTTTWNKKA